MEQYREVLNDKKLKKWLEGKRKSLPEFGDYSDAMLKNKDPESMFESKWRRFLGLLSLLRNKSAHGDVRLRDSDIAKIRSLDKEFSFEKELGFEFHPGDELHIPGKFLPWSFAKFQALASEINE